MLIWTVTILLIVSAIVGWLILKQDSDRYIHEKKSPINFFFRWGRMHHHFFKVAIIAIFILIIFSSYKFILDASNYFALIVSLLAGFGLAAGKELLDKKITGDDIFSSFLGISLGAFLILLLFFLIV